MADVRALAERMGMVRDCECTDGCNRCDGGDYRLPTEVEVRAAIFEAGWAVVIMHTDHEYARIEICRPSEQREGVAIIEEAGSDLVLLALLRALEVARG